MNKRIAALDFTKGALVLFMVLYHWLNYFVGIEGWYYRYLRFLTPSFIFITGFLITVVYLPRIKESGVPLRVMWRGFKLLGLFLVLNWTAKLALLQTSGERTLLGVTSASSVVAVFLTGNIATAGTKVAIFQILVPLAYLLLFAALMLGLRASVRMWAVAAGVAMVLAGATAALGFELPNLELLSMGLLGAVSGSAGEQAVRERLNNKVLLAGAYFAYLAALWIWDVNYPLQVVGTCLTLLALYAMGHALSNLDGVFDGIVLLGRYSLWGYIFQIILLQVLRAVWRPGPATTAPSLSLSLIVAIAITALSAIIVEKARARVGFVDKSYRFVFA